MSNYTKTTDFEAKDSLPSGDSGKIIRGSEFETEFDNIATAIATKADAANPTFTGTVTIDGLTVNGNTTLGNAATDTVTVTADIASNLIPSADDTYNLGAVGAEWNDLFIDGTANIDSLVADTADINGGTIDGVTIGGSSAGAITGTTITGSGDMAIDTDTLFVDVSADRVGVNTSSPTSALDVNGTVTSDGLDVDGSSSGDITLTGAATSNTGIFVKDPTAATYGAFFGYDDTNTVVHLGGVTDGTKNAALVIGRDNNIVQFSGGGDVQFYEDTGTTVKMNWDSSAESLGIGVGAPQASLHIANDASRTQFIASGTVGNDRFLAIDLDITGIEDVAYITCDQADSLAFGEKTNDNDRTIANEHMRISAGGHLLVGKTSQDATNIVGVELKDDGLVVATTDGSQALTLNRKTNDGAIIDLRKNNATIGSIGTAGGTLDIGSGDTTLRFSSGLDAIYPVASVGGGGRDGAVDLGLSSNRFKNLYLSGGLRGDALTFANNAGTEAMRVTSTGNVLVAKTVGGLNSVGSELLSTGIIRGTSDGQNVLQLNRKSSDGAITSFYKDGSTVGSIGTVGGEIYIESGDVGLQFDASGNDIVPYGGGYQDAAIDLGASGVRFKDLYLSGGAYLGGTAAANKLDDYEEGTWTPALADSAGNTATQPTRSGFYVKVGNACTVYGQIINMNTTGLTSSEDLYVTGLPFTSHSTARGISPVQFNQTTNASTMYAQLVASAPGITGTVVLFKTNNDSNASSATVANVSEFVDDASDVFFCMTYITT